MPAASPTVRENLQSWSRTGRLIKLDQHIAKALFEVTPLAALKRLLQHYSIKLSALGHPKAVTMCLSRYYKCSESGREEAARMFLNSSECKRYLDAVPEDVKAPSSEVQILDLDGVDSGDSAKNSVMNAKEAEPVTPSQNSVAFALQGLLSSSPVPEAESLTHLDTHFIPIVHKEYQLLDVVDSAVLVFDKNVDESGLITLKLDISAIPSNTVEEKDFTIPAHAPTIVGLAEPAFWNVKSCLLTFTFPSHNSDVEIITHTTTFNVPELADDEKVILAFRSMGTLRDNRQSDLPVGFQWSLNEAASSSCNKVREASKPSPKDYQKEISVFDAPLVLESAQLKSTSSLEFSFPRRLEARSDYKASYQGYIFVASPRSVEQLMKLIPSISADDGIRELVYELRGSDNKPAYDRITFSFSCSVNCGTMVLPCKGARCDHAAVFSAEAYLRMNQASQMPRWKCPKCEEVVHWFMLRRDRLMEILLGELPSCKEVMVSLDDSKTELVFVAKPEEPESDSGDD